MVLRRSRFAPLVLPITLYGIEKGGYRRVCSARCALPCHPILSYRVLFSATGPGFSQKEKHAPAHNLFFKSDL